MRWFLGLLLASFGWFAAQAQTSVSVAEAPVPPDNRWHTVTESSPFYSEDTARLRMVAILQSDGTFARLIFGEDEAGAYVTVALPAPASDPQTAPALRSELEYSNGARITRTIQDSALDMLAMPGADMMIYSFAVAAEDIDAFRAAARWVLTSQGGTPVAITLDGSSRAIADAQSSDPAQIATTTPEPRDRQTLIRLPAAPLASQ